MTSIALPSNLALAPLVGRTQKRTEVEDLIASYADRHSWLDGAIGLGGFAPVPGAAFAVTVAAIALQAPVIYQPLAKEIAAMYGRATDQATGREVLLGAVMGGGLDVAADFGVEFFKDIATELLTEFGVATVLTFIPVVGAVVGIGLDIYIARKMTWRVGLMVALYYENGARWVGSRKETYELVRRRIKAQGKGRASPPSIREIVEGSPAVRHDQVLSVQMLARVLKDSGLSVDDIRNSLTKRNLDPSLVDEALKGL